MLVMTITIATEGWQIKRSTNTGKENQEADARREL